MLRFAYVARNGGSLDGQTDFLGDQTVEKVEGGRHSDTGLAK
jgi:hypothetical protein